MAIVPRVKAVKVPGGTSLPGRLRVGDRFRGTVRRLSPRARKDVYPRLTLTRLVVTERSKTLSTEELTQLVQGLRQDLNRLSSTVSSLTTFTLSSLSAVRGDISGLRADLATFRADSTG